MKKLVTLLTLLALAVCLIVGFGAYFYLTGSVGGDKNISFEVKEGETYSSIAGRLKQSGLIRNELGYKMMVKMKGKTELHAGVYTLNSSMNAARIIDYLSSKPNYKVVQITFKEGRNMRYFVQSIAQNMNIKEEEIYNKLKDTTYLRSLIEKYWFIKEDVLNSNLYYSLEGYLYPDTYQFSSNAKIEDVFKKMLDNTSKKLEPYKNAIQNSSYSVHQILTMASMVELEASTKEDRKGVAGVFYNRIKSKMSLGSDVTTYYAAKVDMGERDLYKAELTSVNPYNTRSSSMAGKLPVGPICNPSIDSIEAALYPTTSTYYYFVADKNKKVYFTKTGAEHNQIISKLKKEGLWYTY